MKKTKIIIPALGMLLLSTAASVTGTVAWFVTANEVNVGGLTMKAEAENGIVIANESHSVAADWKTSVNATNTGAGKAYVPTSTADCATWYHANAAVADNSAKNEDAYENFTTASDVAVTSGVAKVTKAIKIKDKNAYLVNTFYVQAAAKSDIEGQNLYVTGLTSSATSQDLNKALRLAIVHNSTAKVFGVIGGYTASYTVNGATAVSAADASGTNKVNLLTNTTIPAYRDDASTLKFDVYCYFEGEDANCKSTNIQATMDELSISFKFGNEAAA